jgi:hypothetical protein
MFFLSLEGRAIFTVSSLQTDPLKARFWGDASNSLPHAASLTEDVNMQLYINYRIKRLSVSISPISRKFLSGLIHRGLTI